MQRLRGALTLSGIFVVIYAAAAVLMGRAISRHPPGWYEGIGVASMFIVIAMGFVVACRQAAESRRDADATAAAVAILAAAGAVPVLLVFYPVGVGLSYFVAQWLQ